MKRIYQFIAAICAAAVLVPCCQREAEEVNDKEKAPQEVFKVHFVTDEIQTKTVFGPPVHTSGGDDYPTRWSGNQEKIAVSLNLVNYKSANVIASEDGRSAQFDADFSSSEAEEPYVFYALSPLSACVGAPVNHGGFHLNIPTEQTPLATSCDEGAQLIASIKEVATKEEFASVEMLFEHVTAYGKLTLSNMALSSDEAIQSIDLTASTSFAGQFYYNFAQDVLEASAASRTVTIKPDNLQVVSEGSPAVSSISDIWFACSPCDLGGGTIKVVVNTNKGKLTREVSIPQGKLSFSAGRISKFKVNMSSATYEKAQDRWVLVTDASSLAAGDEIIITNSATVGAAYAMSTTQNSNNRGRVSVSIEQDSDGQLVLQNPGTSVEVIKLVSGDYTGFFRLQEGTSATGRYLYTRDDTNNTNYNYLLSSDSPAQGYANWKITISSNVAYVSAYQSYTKQKTTYYKQIRFNSSNNSLYFAAYRSKSQTSWSSDATNTYDIFIFRKEAGRNIDDDPILEQEEYGAYLQSGNKLYGPGCQQSREYNSDGTVTFAIITPASYEVAEFNGIPASPAKGDTFTLNYNLISGRNRSDTDYNVTVQKVDGPKVWLSTGTGNGFIVKK